MAERLHVGTRKGLFEIARGRRGWEIAETSFLGDPVSAVLADPAGAVTAALDLGHFGAKLWRRDPGAAWRELTVPTFPPKPEDPDDPHPWSLGKVWELVPGGVPARIWAGTMPGGLFRSDDGGASWSLVESLWRSPERKQWFGVAAGDAAPFFALRHAPERIDQRPRRAAVVRAEEPARHRAGPQASVGSARFEHPDFSQ